jgi:hypothetical protein
MENKRKMYSYLQVVEKIKKKSIRQLKKVKKHLFYSLMLILEENKLRESLFLKEILLKT